MHIQKLTLYTSDLPCQVQFYSKRLGLEIIEKHANNVSFNVGNTVLIFRQKSGVSPYHFAFNIPNNSINKAHVWLKKRVDLLKEDDSDIIDFTSWNAKAIYFKDADNNILELIARKTLNNASGEPFSSQQFLEISEIGMPVDNVSFMSKQLNASTGLEIYRGDNDRFSAIGDEHGLFICIDKHKKTWIPTGEKAYSSPFEIQFSNNDREWFMAFSNETPLILTLK